MKRRSVLFSNTTLVFRRSCCCTPSSFSGALHLSVVRKMGRFSKLECRAMNWLIRRKFHHPAHSKAAKNMSPPTGLRFEIRSDFLLRSATNCPFNTDSAADLIYWNVTWWTLSRSSSSHLMFILFPPLSSICREDHRYPSVSYKELRLGGRTWQVSQCWLAMKTLKLCITLIINLLDLLTYNLRLKVDTVKLGLYTWWWVFTESEYMILYLKWCVPSVPLQLV